MDRGAWRATVHWITNQTMNLYILWYLVGYFSLACFLLYIGKIYFWLLLYSIFKSKDITLPTKVCLVKAMVFPVVMYGCESWSLKKAECRRIDASELWCWRRLLRVPWTARRSNQSFLKEISPEVDLLKNLGVGPPTSWTVENIGIFFVPPELKY